MSGSVCLRTLTLECIAIQPGKKEIALRSDMRIRAGFTGASFEWNLIRLQDVSHALEANTRRPANVVLMIGLASDKITVESGPLNQIK